ncbi:MULTISPECIES: transketolase-like TK C-terminal-containing protein [Pseudonocardia]|uniref:Pyruvate dehydrogenase E1 component n=2 Tax=Pseudonocardia TaxID=1847 RepID=A0A1Y2MQ05_PSEAH|nr:MULTISPECIES: pyruvate dehydrogenase [Pseudonocardia]OSY36777.1 Pyruvate dehydrogenase E1 component [Pseudonocardia autotrophica]TDN77107.1 pyruvate dehydrogenase E1 component [Pseudonocardia autotrophica]BBG01113.1 pyruvate dehydrogenase E1 component [Pseudonocardia autotrophica]GEC26832.1 pyruvate dehydrogenase E1 component [Pseudonocardia saturnea]
MTASTGRDDAAIGEIERRVLWLSTAIIDAANRRGDPSGLKVGGHQASSASLVTIMTTLWFEHLRAGDRVSVKPHASPVLHAINYLLGELDESYLPTLRAFGGLQSYPSRSKDPDPVDYSTGSVGIGATAPIWGAVARRYVDSHFGGAGEGRQYSLVGDAELDEGAVWEAILDPMVGELGEVVWVVDLNRQSLDRVVPNIGAPRIEGMFAAAGWQVLTVKYGRLLHELFARPGGEALRERIDGMPNPEYQRLLRCDAAEVRKRLPDGAPGVAQLVDGLDDATLLAAVRNLGGHDPAALGEAFEAIDDSRPTVILAYTVKGHGLATAGHPQNHGSLLSAEQMSELAGTVGADVDDPWRRFDPASPPGRLCAETAGRLRRAAPVPEPAPAVPTDIGRTPTGRATTQAALGRALLDLTREAPDAAGRVVTLCPDVSSSTNLGGWVNKVGVWSTAERRDWFDDDPETILHWRERPTGQHLELGIAEGNLVGALGELGATWSRWGSPVLPIGVLYDPFVERALEPWSFGIYAGGQSILVGTPSGVSLAPEGGAHQSITTPSVGLEQPGCVTYEPAFAIDVEWTLLASLARLGRPDGTSAYLRLSTRPVDQSLAAVPADPAARERRRRQVVAGAYPLRRADGPPSVTIAAMGPLLTEALAAADRLAELGHEADVVCVTAPGLLFDAVQARAGRPARPQAEPWVLDSVFPARRAAPLVTLLDGHPHTLAFLAGINRVPATHLGVTRFGQSGDLASVYAHHGLDADAVVGAALDLL